MNRSRGCRIVVWAVLATAAAAAQAQVASRSPRIGYAYPAGGRQGTEFQITLGGQFLDGASAVTVSGTGVQAAVVEHTKPLTMQQFNRLREQLKELVDKRASAQPSMRKRGKQAAANEAAKPEPSVSWTAADEKLLAEIRKKLASSVRRPPNPAIAEKVLVRVTMTPDAECGTRELRLLTSAGLTNPLAFCVGSLAEFNEKEVKPAVAPKSKPAKKVALRAEPKSAPPPEETRIVLPAIVNGQIVEGDVDRFLFRARKGQRLVAAASARQLIPYLADAVPGWFQATLAIYDARGHELAYSDDFRFHPDPVLTVEIPADGEYVMEIKDAIYRGREDFVYRITVGELPLVTSIFPLGGQAGKRNAVELKGWNLPAAELTVEDQETGIRAIRVGDAGTMVDRVPFAVDTLPQRREEEPNSERAAAQAVTLPLLIDGRIREPGDWDVFRFEGRAGEQIVAEVQARRLNSPLDSLLRLTDAAGKEIAANDDHEDKGAGLCTHHADSWLTAKLPADGTYFVHLGDAQHQGGEEYAYRLRIGPPRPDFELRVVPSSINARSGAMVPIRVYALRHDGFSGDIALALKDAPAGFSLAGARIPAGEDQVRVTLTVAAATGKGPIALHLEGRATIGGRAVLRQAVPADDMMQAFAYRHLVCAGVAGLCDRRQPTPRYGEDPRSHADEDSPRRYRFGPRGRARTHVLRQDHIRSERATGGDCDQGGCARGRKHVDRSSVRCSESQVRPEGKPDRAGLGEAAWRSRQGEGSGQCQTDPFDGPARDPL